MATRLNIGAHLTIAKGIPQGMDLCHEVGATCFQFFTRNPRGGRRREIADEEIAAGKDRRRQQGVRTLVAHLPYTVNLASPRPDAWSFAARILHEDLRHADRIGADLVVVHPGMHVGSGTEAGIARVVEAVRGALRGYEGRASLLLEGMSGRGSEVGGVPSELAAVIAGCDWDERLGVCIDSCHVFASGLDVRTEAGVAAAVRAFEDALGPGRIRCVHLNDSLKPLGSHRDRHARIGRGEIGIAGIRAVATHPLLSTLPLCLETPVDDLRDFAVEIAAVRRAVATRAAVLTAPGRARKIGPGGHGHAGGKT